MLAQPRGDQARRGPLADQREPGLRTGQGVQYSFGAIGVTAAQHRPDTVPHCWTASGLSRCSPATRLSGPANLTVASRREAYLVVDLERVAVLAFAERFAAVLGAVLALVDRLAGLTFLGLAAVALAFVDRLAGLVAFGLAAFGLAAFGLALVDRLAEALVADFALAAGFAAALAFAFAFGDRVACGFFAVVLFAALVLVTM